MSEQKKRRGITVAGSLIADEFYKIDTYPSEGMLTNARDQERHIGGTGNMILDLAKLDPELTVTVSAIVGTDDRGEMLMEALSSITGDRADKELTEPLRELVESYPEVHGAYDLSLHNYGPEEMQGSVHIEVDDDLSALDIHMLSRQIALKIYEEFSIALTIGIYAHNNGHSEIRDDLYEIASKYDEVLEIHAFMVYEAEKLVTFDIIVDFDADREAVKGKILKEIKDKHPEFNYAMIDDFDVSD